MPRITTHRKGCPTGKVRYRSQLDAMLALVSTGRNDKAKRQERRQYRCHLCGGWHLTSQDKWRGWHE